MKKILRIREIKIIRTIIMLLKYKSKIIINKKIHVYINKKVKLM